MPCLSMCWTPSAPFGWKRFSSHLCTAVVDVAVTLGSLLVLEAFFVLLDARSRHHFFCFQFAVLAAVLVVCVGAAHWEAGVMEADVLPSADKRYARRRKKHSPKVLQHAAILGHPSLITGLAAVVTAAVVTGAAWWAADRKYMVVAAAACRVAFFLPVVPELFFGFGVVSFGIEAARVLDFCEKVVLVGCFRVLAVRYVTLVSDLNAPDERVHATEWKPDGFTDGHSAALRGEIDRSPRKAMPGEFQGFAGSGTKKMKAPSRVYPEHAPATGWCGAGPEVLFTGRSRCVRVQAS